MRRAAQQHSSAVGIQYAGEPGETPSISVKGSGVEADEVVKLAKRFGIPVVEDAALARSLTCLELDAAIPASLFKAVAIVLAYLDPEKCRS